MTLLRPLILITLILNLCFGSCLSGDDYSGKSTSVIIGAEFVGGLLGGVVGAIIGGISGHILGPMLGDEPSGMSENMGPAFTATEVISTMIGWIFGCAGGTYWVGDDFHQEGKFLPTLAGSALGLVILSPVGSVIGYNLSRDRNIGYSKGPIRNRFEPPVFSFRTEKTKENKIIPVLDFRLVNAKF